MVGVPRPASVTALCDVEASGAVVVFGGAVRLEVAAGLALFAKGAAPATRGKAATLAVTAVFAGVLTNVTAPPLPFKLCIPV